MQPGPPAHGRAAGASAGAEDADVDMSSDEDAERGDGLVTTAKRHPAPWARSDYVSRRLGDRARRGEGRKMLGGLKRVVALLVRTLVCAAAFRH